MASQYESEKVVKLFQQKSLKRPRTLKPLYSINFLGETSNSLSFLLLDLNCIFIEFMNKCWLSRLLWDLVPFHPD